MDMQMPTPGAAHERLAPLTGHWAGPERTEPSPWSPEAATTRGELRSRFLDGFFVVTDYEQFAADGEVVFRGHGVYGWDPEQDEYVMYWFDSLGGSGGVARGGFDGNRLVFEKTSPLGRHRYAYTFEVGVTVFEMSMCPEGGDWQLLMRGDYERAG